MNELASVIMPSYNTSKFIAESIRSVQAQSYNNWELIIIDDCSTDNTDNVVNQFLDDTRIKYYKNDKNYGAAISRNRALKMAKGKWIAFLDSDDLWFPDKLEKQIHFMKKNGYSFTYSCYGEITEEGYDKNIAVSGPSKVNNIKMHIFNYLGCLTVMYDSTVIGQVEIPDLKKRNDWALWLKIVKLSPCYLFDEKLAYYRVRKSGSITHVKSGKISLLKYHYYMFRKSENLNCFLSVLLCFVNLIGGVLKKVFYINQL